MDVLIEVSARHVHLTQADVETLFGEGAVLEPRRELTQPGLFAAKQKVDIVGPKNTIHSVTILAPVRKYTQIEISKTDARTLGLNAPTRMSGDLADTPGCTLVGPAGSLELEKGVIVARRHLHIPVAIAEEEGLKNNDIVAIEVDEGERGMIMKDVVVRVSAKAGPFVHIDTDEANAAAINGRAYGRLIKL